MRVDTFELSTITTVGVLAVLKKNLYKAFVYSERAQKSKNPMNVLGLQELSYTIVGENLIRLTVVVNPQQLLTNRDTAELFIGTPASVTALKKKLSEGLQQLHYSFSLDNPKRKWMLSRIDYAEQVRTPYHSLYTEMESRGFVPHTDIESHYSGNGSTYRGNKSTRANAYSKEQQATNSRRSYEYKKSAIELYRFEKQVHNVSDLIKKYSLQRQPFWPLLHTEIAEKELRAFHKRHVKPGAYYKKQQLKEVIQGLSVRETTKVTMWEVVHFIEASGGLQRALEAVREQIEEVPDKFNKHNSVASVASFKEFLKTNFFSRNISPLVLPAHVDSNRVDNSYTILFAE